MVGLGAPAAERRQRERGCVPRADWQQLSALARPQRGLARHDEDARHPQGRNQCELCRRAAQVQAAARRGDVQLHALRFVERHASTALIDLLRSTHGEVRARVRLGPHPASGFPPLSRT